MWLVMTLQRWDQEVLQDGGKSLPLPFLITESSATDTRPLNEAIVKTVVVRKVLALRRLTEHLPRTFLNLTTINVSGS